MSYLHKSTHWVILYCQFQYHTNYLVHHLFQVTAQACALHLFSLHSLSLSHQLSTPYPSHPDPRHPVPSAFDMPLGRHIEYDCSTRSHNPIWPSGIRHGPRPPNNKNMGFSGHACISYNRWHCLRGRVLGPGPWIDELSSSFWVGTAGCETMLAVSHAGNQLPFREQLI